MSLARRQSGAVAYYRPLTWFTASTSFANPAEITLTQLPATTTVTIARSLSDTFAGIQLSDVPPFIAAQVAGALAATLLFRWLVPNLTTYADRVVVPHSSASVHSEIR
jgi:glycerol uptake facilitator-like aquaporin